MNTATQAIVAADFIPHRNRKVQATKFVSAFDLGAMDAQRGELCVAEMYYTSLVQMRAYALGHESVVGKTLLSNQLLRRKGGK